MINKNSDPVSKKNYSKWLFFVGLAAVAYLLGFLHGHQNLRFESNLKPEIVNRELKKPSSIDFSLFWDVYRQITENYVDKTDASKMVEGSIKGLVEALGDPYSVYLNKEESRQFMADLNGQFEGIGAELTLTDGILSVVAPIKDSPAEKAGLAPNDKILAIDDKETQNMSLPEAVNRIRGKRGSTVKLIVLKNNAREPKTVNIVRELIKVDSVGYSQLPNGYSLIRISQFGEDTTRLMQKYANQMIKEKSKGLILDLRNNPGGLLDSSIEISSLFLSSDSTVVIEKDSKGEQKEEKTTLEPILKDIPLVVLINEGSASASEIVAGAIQDHARGKVIGNKSFGKGSVQNLIDLSDGSTLRLTIAQWLTPKGRTISHEGIKPDIEIGDDPSTPQDEAADKALEVIKQR